MLADNLNTLNILVFSNDWISQDGNFGARSDHCCHRELFLRQFQWGRFVASDTGPEMTESHGVGFGSWRVEVLDALSLPERWRHRLKRCRTCIKRISLCGVEPFSAGRDSIFHAVFIRPKFLLYVSRDRECVVVVKGSTLSVASQRKQCALLKFIMIHSCN